MFFYLNFRFNAGTGAAQIRVLEPGEKQFPATNTLYVQPGRQGLTEVDTPGGKLLFLGDPYGPDLAGSCKRSSSGTGNVQLERLYEEVRGHYYWFLLHKEGICCGTSFGAIFPIYYHRTAGGIALSSSMFFLAGRSGAETQDRRNLLERLLFNYPFFQSTWWNGVRLLDAHRYLQVNRADAVQAGDFEIARFFGTGEKNSAASLRQLTGLFDDECRLSLPDTPFGISFTGGFDGRTLVAAALHSGRRDFLSYGFGRPGSSDMTYPEKQAKSLGIPYLAIRLDQAYLNHHVLEAAHAFLRLTEYNGNLGRPHYYYAAQRLAENVNCVLTGNFGSEIFRALHQPGVMMTENLIRFFAAKDESWKDQLAQASSAWGNSFFRRELDALIADLERYRSALPVRDPNHRFYHFVFNELFRKYFGPELVMQSHFFSNRTPFLSLPFFRALNDTAWSGVHARLFEKQMIRRMKGQVFYSAYIRQYAPQLYRMNTNKGYSPADVLEAGRRLRLLAGVVFRKYIQKEDADPNAVHAFFLRYRTALAREINADRNAVLQQAGLADILQAPPVDLSLENSIKYYTIAAGWANSNPGNIPHDYKPASDAS